MNSTYLILDASSPQALSDLVSERMATGWTPQGGVAITVHYDGSAGPIPHFYQAMAGPIANV